MKASVLQHVPFETPREFEPVLREAGYDTHTWLVPQDGLPPEDEDALLIMGGPMSVHAPLPWIPAEMDYILGAIQRGIPVIGICLGSQLMARALGGEVYATDHPEIGLCDVTFTRAGLADPALEGFPEILPLIQWHGQGIQVPDSCRVLAYSDSFPVQAFRAAPRAYGLLFHLELNRDALEILCREFPEDIAASGKSATPLIAEALPHLPTLQQLAQNFLRRVLATA